MSCHRVKMICFSPTRTTRRVMEAVAGGINADERIFVDVTREAVAPECCSCSGDDLVIIGAPVYSGRLPLMAVDRFAEFRAAGTPAVLVVLYGNRAYEDALVELSDLAVEAGFIPVAAAAFIGEHSFSTEATPIAVGRPDLADIDKAHLLGLDIAKKFVDGTVNECSTIKVPGNRPYKERMERPLAAPDSNSECELCGACERVCPAGAVRVGEGVVTDAAKCILCCACVKICDFYARKMKVPRVLEISKYLADNCRERKEPEIFI